MKLLQRLTGDGGTGRPGAAGLGVISLVGLLSPGEILAAPHHGSGRPYFQLHYDYEVAGMCGLLSLASERGFQRERPLAAVRSGLDEAALRRLRILAYAAASREWSNRGLGGNRAWCQGEGRAAAAKLKALSGPED